MHVMGGRCSESDGGFVLQKKSWHSLRVIFYKFILISSITKPPVFSPLFFIPLCPCCLLPTDF